MNINAPLWQVRRRRFFNHVLAEHRVAQGYEALAFGRKVGTRAQRRDHHVLWENMMGGCENTHPCHNIHRQMGALCVTATKS